MRDIARAIGTPRQADRTQGAITTSSVGLTVAPAACADDAVSAAEVIVSTGGPGRRLNAMTATPMTAIASAITGGGGSLAGFFIVPYLMWRPEKGKGPKN
ncbi:MAG TPA: hypothetical protein VHB49_16095 [Bradyrhizobium sp.]|nr:hypothetical protein [Bradyrhizobium sp.]